LLADAALKLLENGTFFFDRTRTREVRQVIGGLGLRERTLVLLDAGTGLRMSELFV
jgi:hypothetical protein